MANKQDAKIQIKGKKIVEKACLFQKKISIRKDFDAQFTAFVPRAGKNKPMPQLSIQFSIAYQDVSMICPDVESANQVFYQMASALESWKYIIEKDLEEQRERWLSLQEELANEHRKKPVLRVDFETGEVLEKQVI